MSDLLGHHDKMIGCAIKQMGQKPGELLSQYMLGHVKAGQDKRRQIRTKAGQNSISQTMTKQKDSDLIICLSLN